MAATDLSPLFQPLDLAGTTIPNRVLTSAMTLQYGEGGLISDRHLATYAERARGGVGLMFSEQLTASPLSPSPFASEILAYDERQVERFAALAEALAPYESRFFVQLFCGGVSGSSTAGLSGWAPVRGPSAIGAPGGETPRPLSVGEIEEIVADFVRSARHVKEGGLDGVEIHGAHGWLVCQFLSPFYNRREDAYGGSVENRCRLAIEIGRAIRAEVGPDFPLGLALTYDEMIGEAGITEEDTLAQLEVLCDAELFDFFDLSLGAPHSVHFTIAPMAVPEGFALDFARRARETVAGRAAVFVAGRVVDPAMAAAAVRDGAADMVAMSRAHLADPHLVRKAREGRAAEIRRCVGANVCVGRAKSGDPVACVLSPATGRELEGWPRDPAAKAAPDPAGEETTAAPDNAGPATAENGPFGEMPASDVDRRAAAPRPNIATVGSFDVASPRPAGVRGRRIFVVGAGPAGLRAGAVAAARGHEVTVLERRDRAGGHLADLAWLPTRDGWGMAVEDLVAELERSGAELRLGTEATPDLLAAESPDLVLLAPGAEWEVSGASAAVPDGVASDQAVEPFCLQATEKLHSADPAADRNSVYGRVGVRTPGGPALLGFDSALELAREDPAVLGERVLIADDSGAYAPLGLAEALAPAGTSVRFLTARAEIGAEAAFGLELPHLLPRLGALGVRPETFRAVSRIDDGTVEVIDLAGGEPERVEGVDTVVFALRRRPRDELAYALGREPAEMPAAPGHTRASTTSTTAVATGRRVAIAPAGSTPELRTIGDAFAPRSTAAAIEEAERVALTI